MPRHLAVVGVGEMGRHGVELLLDVEPDLSIRVFDRDESAAEKAAALAPDRVEARVVDGAVDELLDLDGCELVLNFAGPFYAATPSAALSALEHGCAYVDICDDVEGTQRLLDLDDRVASAGLAFVTGAGLSPGLTNLASRYLVDRHRACDELRVAWATRENDPGGIAPLKHMLHMAITGSPQFLDGGIVDTEGFVPSTAARYRFPGPVGEIECYDTAHPEPTLLSRSFPQLRTVTCQGAMLPAWANHAFSSVARLGFGDPTLRVQIGDQEIDPQEFLWRLLWARHDRRPSRPTRHGGIGAFQVVALAGGEELARISMVDTASMARSTSLGAVAVALALLDQDLPAGVHGPEGLDATPAFEMVDRLRSLSGAFESGLVYEPATVTG